MELLTPASITIEEIVELATAGFTGWDKIFNHTFVNTPDGFLSESKIETLLKLKILDIDFYLTENITTPLSVLETLTDERRSSFPNAIRSKAVMNPNCSNGLLNHFLAQTIDIIQILRNMGSHFTDQTFSDLALNIAHDNRSKAILANPNCPIEVLNRYLRTSDDSLNEILASNPVLPVQEVEFLLTKHGVKNDKFFSGIIRNKNLTPKLITGIWNQLLKQTENRYGVVELYDTGILPSKSYTKTTLWVELVEEENGWRGYNKETTKKDKLELLEPYFPELNLEVPEEWMDSLITELGSDLFMLNEDDFNIEGDYRK